MFCTVDEISAASYWNEPSLYTVCLPLYQKKIKTVMAHTECAFLYKLLHKNSIIPHKGSAGRSLPGDNIDKYSCTQYICQVKKPWELQNIVAS